MGYEPRARLCLLGSRTEDGLTGCDSQAEYRQTLKVTLVCETKLRHRGPCESNHIPPTPLCSPAIVNNIKEYLVRHELNRLENRTIWRLPDHWKSVHFRLVDAPR